MIDLGRKAHKCKVGVRKNMSACCDDWVVKLWVAEVAGMRCRVRSLDVVGSSC